MKVDPIVAVRMERSWLTLCFKIDGTHKAKVVPVFSNENLIEKLKDSRIVGAHVFNKRDTAERYAAELCRAYKDADR